MTVGFLLLLLQQQLPMALIQPGAVLTTKNTKTFVSLLK